MNIADISLGMRVRFTPEWRAKLRDRGVSLCRIDRYSSGIVRHIDTAPPWDLVTYEAGDGTWHFVSPGSLERDTSDDITARIRMTAP